MKKVLFLLAAVSFFAACTSGATETATETTTETPVETHCSTPCVSHVETVVE